MFTFDFEKRIRTISLSIDENITTIGSDNRGLLAQNILKLLRDLIDVRSIKIATDQGFVFDKEFDYIEKGHKIILSDHRFKSLKKLHANLLISNSHYTEDKFESEALICSYYENIIEIKCFIKSYYGFDILKELNKYPLDMDEENIKFYREIINKIQTLNFGREFIYNNFGQERYYVQNQKLVCIDGVRLYEVTLTPARDDATRFDRVTAFSMNKIKTKYSIQISKYSLSINALHSSISITLILDYQISIRYSELKHIAKIVGITYYPSKSNAEYINLMNLLKKENIDLLDIVTSNNVDFNCFCSKIKNNSKIQHFVHALAEYRYIILNKKDGYRLLKYFLYNPKNKVLYDQLPHSQEDSAKKFCRNLVLKSGCLVFNDLPFSSSLVGHNVHFKDVAYILADEITNEEMLARKVLYNTIIEGKMYSKTSELNTAQPIDSLITKYNNRVYKKHTNRYLARYRDKVFIQGYEDDIYNIILSLTKLTNKDNSELRNFIDQRLQDDDFARFLESPEKLQIYQQMFLNNDLLLLYGSAGTGKTYTIEAISKIFDKKRILYLANTHSALQNLKRRVGRARGRFFKTIDSFNKSEFYCSLSYDLVIIDECSTISNGSFLKFLRNAKFLRLVLSGDIYQIESIDFGNWFGVIKEAFPNFELANPFRTQNKDLLELWKIVREFDDQLIAKFSKSSFSKTFDSLLLENRDNSIFLCLNYDGLFGINSINRYLQEKNKGVCVEWSVWKFKVGDPILFNDNYFYKNVFYNNLKGRITGITKYIDRAEFEIIVYDSLDPFELQRCGISLIEQDTDKTKIRFSIWFETEDDDDENWKTMVPFQIAYAISIHKAQGLEYDSVNVLISREIEERITFNIFYTAITRAKNNLTIYWSPETLSNVLSNFHKKNYKEDKNILLGKRPLPDII